MIIKQFIQYVNPVYNLLCSEVSLKNGSVARSVQVIKTIQGEGIYSIRSEEDGELAILKLTEEYREKY